MSNFLVGATSTDIQVDTFTGDNSTTGFTLTGADGTTNSARVDIDGVVQKPTTDYSISGTTLTFVAAPPSGTGNITVAYSKVAIVNTPADVSVTTAKIATNNIDETLIKDAFIADFTEVTVAAGDSILLGDVGDSGNTKRDTVQGILDLVPASGGAWNLIGTQVASSSASLTQTGMDSTYDTYAVQLSDMVPATDQANPTLQLGDSGGIDSGAGDYKWHTSSQDPRASTYSASASTSATVISLADDGNQGTGNAAGEGCSYLLYLLQPADSTTRTQVVGQGASIDETSIGEGVSVYGERTAVITCDRVLFKFSSGNIATGRMTVWGISHA